MSNANSTAPASRRGAAQRLSEYRRYWDEDRETMDPRLREKKIVERIQNQLRYVYAKVPFYRRHYDAHGFTPDMVTSLEDFTTKVPVITKKMLVADQAEHPPFGSYLGVERSELTRIHGSSGTMGTPTMYGVSRRDWAGAGKFSCMALWCAGLRPDDVVHISFPFTLFFGGWGLLQAAEQLGACTFPVGTMVSTERQIELLQRLDCDVLVATPSYVNHLGTTARAHGIDVRASAISVAVMGGEPGASIPAVRESLHQLWGEVSLIDLAAGSTSEMYPFTTSMGCLESDGGVHLFQDENYTEVVSIEDPNEPVPPGTSGAVVATHLWRDSQPMIRFWTGDEGVIDTEPCPCGRTYPRMPKGVYGRLDDMLLVRGANVYPSAIESVVRGVEGSGGEFRIIVDRPADLDEITVEVERDAALATDRAPALQATLQEQFKNALGVRVAIRVVEPATFEQQTFKARRVIDRRSSS
ncbi:MAG: phenylacetate--CoA ligase family protein [Pseudonocardiaceae bacterium]|nr:phenylacetate--CoA ligase family protein [Pseudonocardiaceae bacterium]